MKEGLGYEGRIRKMWRRDGEAEAEKNDGKRVVEKRPEHWFQKHILPCHVMRLNSMIKIYLYQRARCEHWFQTSCPAT
jgi:hypothetical protein